VSIKTFGVWRDEARQLVTDPGTRLAVVAGNVRATLILRQKIDVAILLQYLGSYHSFGFTEGLE